MALRLTRIAKHATIVTTTVVVGFNVWTNTVLAQTPTHPGATGSTASCDTAVSVRHSSAEWMASVQAHVVSGAIVDELDPHACNGHKVSVSALDADGNELSTGTSVVGSAPSLPVPLRPPVPVSQLEGWAVVIE